MPEEKQPVGLLLADDLMWISRIGATALARDVKLFPARNLERLEELARQHSPACVILDLSVLDSLGVPVAEALVRLRAAAVSSPRFVAYGSHVDVADLQAARAAGCDPVLPRSQMADRLEEWLKEWFGVGA